LKIRQSKKLNKNIKKIEITEKTICFLKFKKLPLFKEEL